MQLAAAHRDRRRQDILLVVLAAVIARQPAFSDSLTRSIEGVPTLWAFGAPADGRPDPAQPRPSRDPDRGSPWSAIWRSGSRSATAWSTPAPGR
ncbi:hypothetical protein, partial [Caulobacter sp. B11]|uniref:hypothetical protein n=1 Tax=Caulobacter sp. B11 TaxID=2048899 RepID=UPI001F3D61FA